ncbi:MAG: nucleotidyl transferase AbiEii/AbiGii toxin family protein [Bacteroidales bacterium]|nr:nucleotidyl transferase AbiEii/AbiGii toxin family protein [Bacteroidales bacterium]
MTFHENKKEFKEAILAAGEYFGIREVLIEKDYWVSFVLKNLSQSEYKDWVVFKGGTALAKSYTFIARFSEDIDLALISKEKLGDAKRKTLFKNIENTLSTGLEPVNHPDPLKKGRNRKTFVLYSAFL